MNIVYIVAIVILLIILYPVYKHSNFIFSGWNKVTGAGRKIICVLSFVVCLFTIASWLFLVYWTISSWHISIDSSHPKPYFLIIYVPSLFILAISMSLSQVLYGLSQFKKDKDSGNE